MGRASCCCGCTFRDQRFDDADGVLVTEEFQQWFVGTDSSSSSQIVAGGPFNCKGAIVPAVPPCREVIIDSTTDGSGLTYGVTWWRWYESTTFDPDGSSPLVGYRHDAIQNEFKTDFADSHGAQQRFGLAIRQGASRAFAPSGGEFVVDDPASEWFHYVRPTKSISDPSWDWQIYTTDGFGRTNISFTPDLTNGADPITFGLHLTMGFAGGAGISSFARMRCQVDNFCLIF